MSLLSKRSLFGLLGIVLTVQACASMGGTQSDTFDTYEHDYNTMVETVEQAVRGTALNIDFAQESDDKSRYVILFSRTVTVGTQSAQSSQGEVIVEKVSENKTRVKIENPDYHFSLPSHKREDYRSKLTKRIKSLLEKQ